MKPAPAHRRHTARRHAARRHPGVATALAFAVLAASCTDDGPTGSDSDSTTGSPADAVVLSVALDPDDGVSIGSDGEPLLSSAGDRAFAWRTAVQTAAPKGGVYLGHELLSTQPESEVPWIDVSASPVASGDGGDITSGLNPGGVRAGDSDAGSIEAEPAGDGITRLTVYAPADANEITVSFACRPDERFYGFGAQTWASQHRGETVPMWVVEQGLGKITPDTPDPPSPALGEPYDSYLPIPWFASSAGYGIALDTFAYSTFELCTEQHPDRWSITTWSNQLSWYVLAGDTPKDLLVSYTGLVGRARREPPDWFYAPMNDAVRGRANVERVAKLIRDNDIASSVIWTEDWIGLGSAATGLRLSHDWDPSPQDYPDLGSMTAALHDAGFRFLGYFSPFVPDAAATPGGQGTLPSGETVTLHPQNDRKWPEAVDGGFLMTDDAGQPYRMLTPPFVAPMGGQLDVTEPQAVEWFQSYVEAAEAAGLDGSMTDFGEWVPRAARFADGRTGAEVHNEFPVLWQRANREVWERLRPDGDYLFYVRSGYTGTAEAAPAVWGGDQNTTFDRLDGLGSVVTMGVNLGLSGIGYYGHDIAGYSAFAIPGVENTPTTKELFLRWAAIGAYTPMMRTHHGSRYGENWSFEGAPNPANPSNPIEDPETLATWKRLADEHISLFPYLQALGSEYARTGVPIMRHLILEYPDDRAVQRGRPDDERFDEFAAVGLPRDEMFQYLLGADLLVAPIVDQGATARPVYLPEGRWYDVRSGEGHQGPVVIEATAAPGDIPVFARAGAVVARLPSGVETLVPTEDPDVIDLDAVADERVLDVYLGSDGRFALNDGTRFELRSRPGPETTTAVEVRVDSRTLPVGAAPEGFERVTVVTVPATGGGEVEAEITVGDTASVLRILDAPPGRRHTLRIRG